MREDLTVSQIDEQANRQLMSIREHFDPVLEKLEGFKVELAGDPIALGVAQFNHKLATLRANANTANTELARAIALTAKARDTVVVLQAALDEKIRNLIVLDPDISKISGMEAKRLHAQQRCEREARLLFQAERIHALLKGYNDAFRVLARNVTDTKADLMKQLAVVKQQILLGEQPANVMNGAEVEGSPRPSRLEQAERELAEELGTSAGTVAF